MKMVVLLISIYLAATHPKGDALRLLAANAVNNVIELELEQYNEFILTHPRPYDAVILYTLKHRCVICETTRIEFEQVAASFHKSGATKPDMKFKKRAVFFFVVFYSTKVSRIFADLKLQSTSAVLFSEPASVLLGENNLPYINYEEENLLTMKEKQSNNADKHKIVEFINNRTKRNVKLTKDPIKLAFIFGFLLVLAKIAHFLLVHRRSWVINRHLWLAVAVVILICCFGGMPYNLIHKASLFKRDAQGKVLDIVSSNQRSQYAGEGLVMGILLVIAGMCFVLFSKIPKIFTNMWVVRILSMLILIFILILIRVIGTVFNFKAKWYGPTFLPPDYYVAGPLSNDKGNAF